MQNVVERYISAVMGLNKQKSKAVNHTHAMEADFGLSENKPLRPHHFNDYL